ncbi:hypothetical protein H6G93_35330 [Nostoc sp. FACHB-973]|nr:hypothetical protein [Nostoc sp. FACHB-973]
MDKFLKTCLSPTLDDNYLSKNDASTQVLYLNNRIFSDFFFKMRIAVKSRQKWTLFSCNDSQKFKNLTFLDGMPRLLSVPPAGGYLQALFSKFITACRSKLASLSTVMLSLGNW